MADDSQDRHSQSADALRAMAAGEHSAPDAAEAPDPLGGQSAPAPAGEAAADAEELAQVRDLTEGHDAPEARARRAADFQARQHVAHAYHYKRTMIPPLLVVGVLLLLAGGGALVIKVLDGRGDHSLPTDSPLLRHAGWLVLSSWLLGAILLLGAWLFHRDVTEADRAGGP